MDLQQITENINVHKAELENLNKKFSELVQAEFTKMTASFFESTPKVKAIVWSQYTPYFNDGETCTFSVNDVYFIGDEFDPDDILSSSYEYEDIALDIDANPTSIARYREYANTSKNANADSEYWNKQADNMQKMLDADDGTIQSCAAVRDLIKGNEGVMLDMFDDHVMIIVTPGNTEVLEYDHD